MIHKPDIEEMHSLAVLSINETSTKSIIIISQKVIDAEQYGVRWS